MHQPYVYVKVYNIYIYIYNKVTRGGHGSVRTIFHGETLQTYFIQTTPALSTLVLHSSPPYTDNPAWLIFQTLT